MNEEQLSQIIRDVIAKQGGTTMNLFDRHMMEKVIDAAVARADELKVGVKR